MTTRTRRYVITRAVVRALFALLVIALVAGGVVMVLDLLTTPCAAATLRGSL